MHVFCMHQRVKICKEWREGEWSWRHCKGTRHCKGSTQTRQLVHGDANRALIWAWFASPRIARSKCVGPLGWVFPAPVKNGPNHMLAFRLCRAIGDALKDA
jgi:hypothetical protein